MTERSPRLRPLLSLPGGKVEAQDARDPVRTALREFHEETGNVFSAAYAGASRLAPLPLCTQRLLC